MDQTPWPTIIDLTRYWKKFPPTHVLVRSFFTEKEPAPTREASDAQMQRVFQAMNQPL